MDLELAINQTAQLKQIGLKFTSSGPVDFSQPRLSATKFSAERSHITFKVFQEA